MELAEGALVFIAFMILTVVLTGFLIKKKENWISNKTL